MRGSGLGVMFAVAAMMAAACTSGPAAPSSGSAPESATGAHQGLTEYFDRLVRMRQFRGAVEVRLGDEVLLRQGFDHADVQRKVANTPDTRFRIASLTKQFTGLAVLILQEQGKLEVSDPLCTHLPGCPATWRAITVEHLLTHTAGLFNYTEHDSAEWERYGALFGPEPTPEQLIQTFADLPLDFPPGSDWSYSNSGYALLGHLVERLSGHTYGQFLETEILDPLGMSDTAYRPGQQDTGRDAVGYEVWTKPVEPDSDAVPFAAGGIRSTLADLARWNQFLLTATPAIVESDTLAQLLRPRVDTAGGERYGFGIQTRGTGDDLAHFHDGSIAGFSTYSEVRPATELSIIVLSNLQTADSPRLARDLAVLATA